MGEEPLQANFRGRVAHTGLRRMPCSVRRTKSLALRNAPNRGLHSSHFPPAEGRIRPSPGRKRSKPHVGFGRVPVSAERLGLVFRNRSKRGLHSSHFPPAEGRIRPSPERKRSKPHVGFGRVPVSAKRLRGCLVLRDLCRPAAPHRLV